MAHKCTALADLRPPAQFLEKAVAREVSDFDFRRSAYTYKSSVCHSRLRPATLRTPRDTPRALIRPPPRTSRQPCAPDTPEAHQLASHCTQDATRPPLPHAPPAHMRSYLLRQAEPRVPVAPWLWGRITPSAQSFHGMSMARRGYRDK